MATGTRDELLAELLDSIASVDVPHPTRVGVDGPPAAGKTTLSDELAAALRAQGREVIRASIESYYFPSAQRWRRGKYSPVSCYEDSLDFDAVYDAILDPLGPGGDREYRLATYDWLNDTPASPPPVTAGSDAVLIFEGVFAMRPELFGKWDFRILVTAPFEQTLARARVRDLETYGSLGEVERRFTERYGPSQRHYFATVRPTEIVDVVVHNDDPGKPRWERPTQRSNTSS